MRYVQLCGGAAILVVASALVTAQSPLVLVRSIDLPGVEGRIDHLSVDLDTNQLFLAALGNNSVEVVDLAAGTQARSLSGFHEPQGLQVVPDRKVVAVANGQSGNLQIIDGATLQSVRTVPLSDDADNVRYERSAKRLYVGHGSGALAAIDVADWRVLGTVPLSGHPESFQLETAGPRVFVNVPDARHVAVVDRQAMKVLMTWPLVGAQANYPMALDEVGHRLYVGCRRPARVLVYDTSTGKIVGSADIVGDTDDMFYDGARKRLYVSGGEGFVDVFQVGNSDRLTRLAHIATAPGARTSLFVPQQSRLYLAVPHRGAQKAEIRVFLTSGADASIGP
jgi:DNA-binding beta-propeller fold protein YncE